MNQEKIGMRLKSYFAASVEAALAEGSRELGPEALIVQSRKSPPESRRLGEYEVVLAVAGAERRAVGPATRVAPQAADGAEPGGLAREMAALRRQMEAIRRSIGHAALAGAADRAGSSAAAEIYAALTESDLDPEIAHRVAEKAAGMQGGEGDPAEFAQGAAVDALEKVFSVDARLGVEGAEGRVAALIGPPGSGKTTTLAKLAVAYGLTARRPVLLVSTDTWRIGAADHLRSFAGILGVGFELAATTAALDQTLNQHRAKGLILIDTPGFAAADMDQAGDLARYIARRREIDTHLVLSASMRSADITRAVDRFEIFRPAKLLFTRLDETESLGPLVSEAARTQKPISFLCNGQDIPEHLEAASKRRLVASLLSDRFKESLAAA
jgi:flagellar biosynthesis protein FlhF